MQFQIQSPLNKPQNLNYSDPVALIKFIEVKLEEQVLCGELVCNSHLLIPNHDL